MRKMLETLGRYVLLMRKVFMRPDKPRIFFKQVFVEMEKLGMNSIAIVAIISVFIGAVITLQMAYNLENPMIPKTYVGLATRDILLLEFSSTIIALILAGKVGSNITSEIGSMRITEQIDAMEMMGVNSANYLILPKVVSSVIFNPFLVVLSALVGMIGGAMIAVITGVVNLGDYIEGLRMYFQSYYLFYSMVKMAFFSFVITTVPAFYGYYAKGGSLDVGRASTNGIVSSSVLVLVLNLLLTQVLLS
jgi:phospholipid/cholesterol/gamma-HCH transport system permease protein